MSTIPFLSSKFSIPPLDQRHIARPRLVEKLDACLEQYNQLILLTAPAGYGKTCLLSEWIHTSLYLKNQKLQVCWISFENEDVNFQRFAFLLAAALRVGSENPEVLFERFKQTPGRAECLQLLSESVALREEENILLVLEDYSWTSDECLQALLQGLPSSFQIIISSRHKPAAWIVRYRLKGRVAEINQNDLRFQDNEILAFLEGNTRQKVSSKISRQFLHRTEGWAVALRLAVWRINSNTDLQEVVDNLRGDEDLLLDYLINEVYQKQTPENQRFLRWTSVLYPVNPQICDAIRQNKDSAVILDNLYQTNVFLSAMDEKRNWYRYHNLFQDFLQKRLLEEDGQETFNRLHILASEWLAGQPDATREAARHAMLAGDHRQVVKLMETGTYNDILTIGYPLMMDILLKISEKEFTNSPWLCILGTWALTFLGITIGGKTNKEWLKITKASLEKNREKIEPRSLEFLQSEINTLEAFVNADILSDPLAGLKETISFHFLVELAYCIHQNKKFNILGDYRSAVDTLEKGFLLSRLKGEAVFTQYLKCRLILENIYKGRLGEAEKLLAEREEWLDSSDSIFAFNSLIQIFRGKVALLRNQLGTAGLFAEQVLEKYTALNQFEKYLFLIFLVEYYLALEDWQNAHHYLIQCRELAQEFTSPDFLVEVNQLNCLLDLRQGFYERVNQYLRISASSGKFQNRDLWYKQVLLSSRFSLAQAYNKTAGQETLLKTLEELNVSIKALDEEYHPLLWTEMLILKALLLQELGKSSAALQVMEIAVHTGSVFDYQRLFLSEGRPVLELLAKLLKMKIEPVYCRKILKANSQKELPKAAIQAQESDDQIITRREREILYYVAKGNSNEEIATRLVISLATVKKHLSNLYKKLGVNSRRQAVKEARQKGWIKEIHLKE